jgi:mRNA interferase RelE/StbE
LFLLQNVIHANDKQCTRFYHQELDKSLAKIPLNGQKRIVAKIREVALNPYAPNHNLTKLQGREGYRLQVGEWRVIYEFQDDRLVMLFLELGARGGIYK